MVLENSFVKFGGLPFCKLQARRIDTSDWLQEESFPEPWKTYRARYWEQALQSITRTYSDDPTFSLSSIKTLRSANKAKEYEREKPYPILVGVRRASFRNFFFPNLFLDEPFEHDGRKATARSHFSLQEDQLRLESLQEHHELVFRIGVNTLFVTADNKMVISIRSKSLGIADSGYHVSAAEGMTAEDVVSNEPLWGGPFDSEYDVLSPDERKVEPSIPVTVCRSLDNELGLKSGVDYDPSAVRLLAYLLDTERAEPLFVFYVKSTAITFETLYRQWCANAPDRFENRDLVGYEWSRQFAAKACCGMIDYCGKPLTVASNHAQASFMLGAQFTFSDVIDECVTN